MFDWYIVFFSGSTERMINKVVADAATKNSWRAVHKWTETVDGKLRIRSIPPILVPYREILSGFRNKEWGF